MVRAGHLIRTASLGLFFTALLAVATGWAWSSVAAPASASPARAAAPVLQPQEAVRPPQEIKVTASKYSFSPSRIEVQENDVVKVTLETADIPHSFTIDDDNYRIAKRATPGHPVVFEFRADKAGTFPFYCNLTTDPNCKSMRGELVVRPRK